MGKVGERKIDLPARDVEAGSSTTANTSQTRIVKPATTWKSYIWDTWELPKDERWLLFKVDAFVLTFASVKLCPRLLFTVLLFSAGSDDAPFIAGLLPQEP